MNNNPMNSNFMNNLTNPNSQTDITIDSKPDVAANNDDSSIAVTTDQNVSVSSANAAEADGKATDAEPSKHIRIVNTFMKRRTHMNKNAEQALTDPEFAQYLVNNSSGDGNLENIHDLRILFIDTPNGSDAPLTLEIGFGLGDSLIEMAAAEPARNFVGIEVQVGS